MDSPLLSKSIGFSNTNKPMQLKNLLNIHGKITWRDCDPSLQASGVFFDTRELEPYGVFVAIRGNGADGHKYLSDANARGAYAIVVEDISAVPDFFRGAVVEVLDSRAALQALSQRFYGNPGDRMLSVAVTGTNGKTSFSYILEHMMNAVGVPCGVMGTIDHHVKEKTWRTSLTTPDPVTLQKRLLDFEELGAESFVIEASSHALKQERIRQGIDIAVFTNFSRDHMDYHPTEEDYFQSKARLFTKAFNKEGGKAFGLVNGEDPYGQRIAIVGDRECFTFGESVNHDFSFEIQSETLSGCDFKVRFPKSAPWVVNSPLVGRHNVYNTVAALATVYLLGFNWQRGAQALRKFTGIPGRLQHVPNSRGIHAFVDFAHTDEALRSVLTQMKTLGKKAGAGRLICVFGCGGDRDRGKRKFMGKVATELSRHVVVTSDNPRTEDAHKIIDDILDDRVVDNDNIFVEVDRDLAIAKAVSLCRKGDILVVAGKGHEKYQTIGVRKMRFDDVKILGEALNERN